MVNSTTSSKSVLDVYRTGDFEFLTLVNGNYKEILRSDNENSEIPVSLMPYDFAANNWSTSDKIFQGQIHSLLLIKSEKRPYLSFFLSKITPANYHHQKGRRILHRSEMAPPLLSMFKLYQITSLYPIRNPPRSTRILQFSKLQHYLCSQKVTLYK